MVGGASRYVNGGNTRAATPPGRAWAIIGAAVGFFDRFAFRSSSRRSTREGRLARDARARELAGDLGAAVALYTEAGLRDEAARVLLLRADAEPSVERRLAFCAAAAAGAASDELRRTARGRKALIAFDTLRGRGTAFLVSEVLAVARALEDAGELEHAAEAYALAGDAESEVRALTAAGAIEKLEERLRASETAHRAERELELGLRRLTDLDRTAERRAALELARASLSRPSMADDPRLVDAARGIRARLLRGPVVELEIGGQLGRWALGDEVTVGRGDATIVVASRSLSRRHLRVARAGVDGRAFVEDLATRNGTLLAGARLSGPLPVGAGVRLMLGGDVPCAVTPVTLPGGAAAFAIEVAGGRYLATLGALAANGWRVTAESTPDDAYVVLSTPEGIDRPYLGSYQLAARIELCHGDEIRAARGGPICLRVPAMRASSPLDDETHPHGDFVV